MKDEGTFCKTLGREAKCDGIPVGWYTICFSIVSKKSPAEYLESCERFGKSKEDKKGSGGTSGKVKKEMCLMAHSLVV